MNTPTKAAARQFPLTDFLCAMVKAPDRVAIANAGKVALDAGCKRDWLEWYLNDWRNRA